jgi:hypothetical protein
LYTQDVSLHDELMHLEEELLETATRHNRQRLEQLIAPDFREFGSSGRVFDRAAILESLLSEPPGPAIRVSGFAIQPLTDDLVLVTYRTHKDATESLRSSLWRRHEGAWQILFHQGTRVPVASR